MTNKPDWADEIADCLHDEMMAGVEVNEPNMFVYRAKVMATALRKAKADGEIIGRAKGWREAIDQLSWMLKRWQGDANTIEKGEA